MTHLFLLNWHTGFLCYIFKYCPAPYPFVSSDFLQPPPSPFIAIYFFLALEKTAAYYLLRAPLKVSERLPAHAPKQQIRRECFPKFLIDNCACALCPAQYGFRESGNFTVPSFFVMFWNEDSPPYHQLAPQHISFSQFVFLLGNKSNPGHYQVNVVLLWPCRRSTCNPHAH